MITSSPTIQSTSFLVGSPHLPFLSRSNHGLRRRPTSGDLRNQANRTPPSTAITSPSYRSSPRCRDQAVQTTSPLQGVPINLVTVDAATQWSPGPHPISYITVPIVAQDKRPKRAFSSERASTSVETALPMSIKPEELRREPKSTVFSVSSSGSGSAATSSTTGSSSKRARPPQQAAKMMPLAYENCDVKDLVILISEMLMQLIDVNDKCELKDGGLTRFHSRAPPGISVVDYLQRLATHATLSPPILLSMVYYIDKLCALYPSFTISSLTVHRFLIASATVASKGLSDAFWTNTTYARVGGVSLKELTLLELEFLTRVEWRIVPKPEVLVDYYRSLIEHNDGYLIDEGQDTRPDS